MIEKQYYDGYLINFSSSTGYPTIFVNGKNVLLHRYIWEKFNGDIPKDMQIHHLDKNKLNFNIDNLVLIDTKEHHRNHALEHKLGVSNKGKPKKHASGFCGLARKIKAVKNSEVLFFNSISEATRHFKLNRCTIPRVLKGDRKRAYGWRFEYVNA